MTHPVEIPDEAVEAACEAHHDAYTGWWRETNDREQMRAALVAARPYLMPTRVEILRAIGDTINRRIEFVESPKAVQRAYEEAVDAVLALLSTSGESGE